MTTPADAPPSYFDTGWTGGRNPWVIAFVVSMATFMEVLDTSIANVSLPHIAGNLSATQDESTWVLTSYLVSNAVVLPISGWLATKLGRKRYYMISVALFTASSFLCGVAPSLGLLIVFRVLQGVGGGGLAPSEQSILVDTFPAKSRGMAMAIYGMAVVLAPAIGPTLGGAITDSLSWRWIFFINIPVGVMSLLLTSHVVSDPPHLVAMRERARGIDYIGLGLIAVGLGCLEFVLDKGQEDDWFNSPAIVGFTIAAGASLIGFILWELEHEHPIIDIRMFKRRAFASSTALMVLLGMVLYAPTVLLPQFEQTLMGYSAQQAGETLSPGALALIVVMPLAGALVAKVDARWLIAVGCSMLAISLYYVTRHLDVDIDFRTAVLLRAYQTIGFAFLFVPINSVVYAGVPPEQNNAVSGVLNLGRNLGGSIGIAVVTTQLARHAQLHQSALANHTDNYHAPFVDRLHAITGALQHAGSTAPDAAHQALAIAYRQLQVQATQLAYLDALRTMAVVAACMIPLLLFASAAKGAAHAA